MSGIMCMPETDPKYLCVWLSSWMGQEYVDDDTYIAVKNYKTCRAKEITYSSNMYQVLPEYRENTGAVDGLVEWQCCIPEEINETEMPEYHQRCTVYFISCLQLTQTGF